MRKTPRSGQHRNQKRQPYVDHRNLIGRGAPVSQLNPETSLVGAGSVPVTLTLAFFHNRIAGEGTEKAAAYFVASPAAADLVRSRKPGEAAERFAAYRSAGEGANACFDQPLPFDHQLTFLN